MQTIQKVLLASITLILSCSEDPAPVNDKFRIDQEAKRTEEYTRQLEEMKTQNQQINQQMQQKAEADQQALDAKEKEVSELSTKVKTLEDEKAKGTDTSSGDNTELVKVQTELKTQLEHEKATLEDLIKNDPKVPANRVGVIEKVITQIKSDGVDAVTSDFILAAIYHPDLKKSAQDFYDTFKKQQGNLVDAVKGKLDIYKKYRVALALKYSLKKQNRLSTDGATSATLDQNPVTINSLSKVEQNYKDSLDKSKTAATDFKKNREEGKTKLITILEEEKKLLSSETASPDDRDKRLKEIDAEIKTLDEKIKQNTTDTKTK